MDLTNYKNNSIVFETLIFNVMNVVVLDVACIYRRIWGFSCILTKVCTFFLFCLQVTW